MRPTKVTRPSAGELSVLWDDGHEGRHTMSTLRASCPCASCKQEHESEARPPLFPIIVPGQFELRTIQTVGNYALQMIWGDGHQTGIYTFEHLRRICECEECMKKRSQEI